jgi:hypothetical protein
MTFSIMARRKFVGYAAAMVMAIAASRTCSAGSVLICELVEFADISERIMRIPCQLLDRKHCFSLDRFDPTCPQCM